VLLLLLTAIEADTPDKPYKFSREFTGLNEEQIAAIRKIGRACRVEREYRAQGARRQVPFFSSRGFGHHLPKNPECSPLF
jgi:hypothetical protein